MPRPGGEHRGLAAVGDPLHVAAEVRDHRLGADVAQRRRLALGADERAHAVATVEQQREDPAAEPAMGAGDEYDHSRMVTGMRGLDSCFGDRVAPTRGLDRSSMMRAP